MRAARTCICRVSATALDSPSAASTCRRATLAQSPPPANSSRAPRRRLPAAAHRCGPAPTAHQARSASYLCSSGAPQEAHTLRMHALVCRASQRPTQNPARPAAGHGARLPAPPVVQPKRVDAHGALLQRERRGPQPRGPAGRAIRRLGRSRQVCRRVRRRRRGHGWVLPCRVPPRWVLRACARARAGCDRRVMGRARGQRC